MSASQRGSGRVPPTRAMVSSMARAGGAPTPACAMWSATRRSKELCSFMSIAPRRNRRRSRVSRAGRAQGLEAAMEAGRGGPVGDVEDFRHLPHGEVEVVVVESDDGPLVEVELAELCQHPFAIGDSFFAIWQQVRTVSRRSQASQASGSRSARMSLQAAMNASCDGRRHSAAAPTPSPAV
jgi:hypothetical protein